jgi:hypothetical protein
MFRLGLLLTGGAQGPGVFFIVPCLDIVEIIDMRVQTFNVPPQEATEYKLLAKFDLRFPDSNKRQRDCFCECHHVVQSKRRHNCCSKC